MDFSQPITVLMLTVDIMLNDLHFKINSWYSKTFFALLLFAIWYHRTLVGARVCPSRTFRVHTNFKENVACLLSQDTDTCLKGDSKRPDRISGHIRPIIELLSAFGCPYQGQDGLGLQTISALPPRNSKAAPAYWEDKIKGRSGWGGVGSCIFPQPTLCLVQRQVCINKQKWVTHIDLILYLITDPWLELLICQ